MQDAEVLLPVEMRSFPGDGCLKVSPGVAGILSGSGNMSCILQTGTGVLLMSPGQERMHVRNSDIPSMAAGLRQRHFQKGTA